MTNAALQRMDAKLRSRFKATGWADNAVFKSGSVSIPDCTIMVDRGIQLIGDQSQVISDQTALTCYLDQTGKEPVRGDSFEVGDETFIVDSISQKDETEVICIVTKKACCS